MEEHEDNLSPNHRAFVEAYLSNGFNATKAAETAGYEPKFARTAGWRLLNTNADIRREVDAYLAELGVTRERVLKEIVALAIGNDPADFEEVLKGGSLKELRKAGVDTRRIKTIKIKREVVGVGEEAVPYENVTLELYDRQRSLEQLAKALALVEGQGVRPTDDSVSNPATIARQMDAVTAPWETTSPMAVPGAVRGSAGGSGNGQDGIRETPPGAMPSDSETVG